MTKILLQPASHSENGSYTATSVQFVSNSTTSTAKASREIILSGGAIQTPQLLELSGENKRKNANSSSGISESCPSSLGIGNSTLLKSLNATALIDLPGVGENLQVI